MPSAIWRPLFHGLDLSKILAKTHTGAKHIFHEVNCDWQHLYQLRFTTNIRNVCSFEMHKIFHCIVIYHAIFIDLSDIHSNKRGIYEISIE